MRGNITRRGKASWRLKFDIGTDLDGKRLFHFETVRGTKREAEAALTKRLSEIAEDRYVRPTVETVGGYARHWLEHIAPNADRCASTVERYRSLIETHIIPNLGTLPLQELDSTAIDKLYTKLRTDGRWYGGGLSSGTLQNVHRVLSQILNSAIKKKKLARSPLPDIETKPKGKSKNVEVLEELELAVLLTHLRGRPLYVPVLLTAYTGLRRGEVLGLRWQDIDFSKGTLRVVQTIYDIGGKLSVKAPKTESSRRTIRLPNSLLPQLTHHRKEQAALRLKLGLGKDSNDLVFTTQDGKMFDPACFAKAFVREVAAAGVKRISFHALRHTHITHLLRDGVPVHVVSARAGHARASITLDTYSHLLGGDDENAAARTDAMLQRALGG